MGLTGTAEREGDDASRPVVEEMTYTAASAELDEIVRFFEQREVDVDQLVARLVRATAIIEELDSRLRRTRVQVEELVPRLSAVLGDSRAAAPVRGAAGDAPLEDVHAAEGMEDPAVADPEDPEDMEDPAVEDPEVGVADPAVADPEGMADPEVAEGMASTIPSDDPGAPGHPGLF